MEPLDKKIKKRIKIDNISKIRATKNTFRLLLHHSSGVICERFWPKGDDYIFNSNVAEQIKNVVEHEINRHVVNNPVVYECTLILDDYDNLFTYTIPIKNRQAPQLYRLNIKSTLPHIIKILNCKKR